SLADLHHIIYIYTIAPTPNQQTYRVTDGRNFQPGARTSGRLGSRSGSARHRFDHFSRTSVGGGDALSVSRCRSLRIPASSTLLGANLRSHRKRLARPPAVYRTFGRTAIAAFTTASATTPGSSAAAITAFSVLSRPTRTSRYSSSFESGSSTLASNCVFVYAG